MLSLTSAVIQYWTQRLAQRIDQKINALAAAEPGLRDRLAAQARQGALRWLGLEELQTELDAITEQKQQWEQRQRQAQRAMLAVLRRQPLEAVAQVVDEAMQVEIRQAIAQRQAIQQEQLLAADARASTYSGCDTRGTTHRLAGEFSRRPPATVGEGSRSAGPGVDGAAASSPDLG